MSISASHRSKRAAAVESAIVTSCFLRPPERALLEKTLELKKEKARSEKLSCKVDSLHGQWERWDGKRKWKEEDEKREEERRKRLKCEMKERLEIEGEVKKELKTQKLKNE